MTTQEHPRLAVGPEDAASMIGVSTSTMRRLLDSGAIRSVKLGRRRLVPIEALAELLAT